jgi:2-dehydropantoate 2-reductase
MKITVMGSGGVGGYFGARLAAAGNDVTFVARGAHLAAMKAKGLRLDSEIGNLHLDPVKAVADAREVPAADAIIFAVKMRDTESAAESLAPLVSKGATVFTFQNGVESAERIGRCLGPGNVVEGAARIASNIPEPGVIKQVGKFAILEFGERDGKPSARTTAFRDACQAAGITASLSDNISRTLWLKFAMLAPLAGMTALTRGPLGPIRSNPDSYALVKSAVEETVAVGAALKAGVEPEDAARTMKQIDGLPGGMMASMCHDLLAGKPLELAGLSGAVARLAKANGVAAPTHAFIAAALAPFAEGKPQT